MDKFDLITDELRDRLEYLWGQLERIKGLKKRAESKGSMEYWSHLYGTEMAIKLEIDFLDNLLEKFKE